MFFAQSLFRLFRSPTADAAVVEQGGKPPTREIHADTPVTTTDSAGNSAFVGEECIKAAPLESDRGKTIRQGYARADERSAYVPGHSFIDRLPWAEALPLESTILLDDGRSVGAAFEVQPRGTEGRTEAFLIDLRDALEEAFQDAFDERDEAPWVLQTYTFNDKDLSRVVDDLDRYICPGAQGSLYSEAYLQMVRAHFAGITRPGGLFLDESVTRTPWGGAIQRNYVVIYRRIPSIANDRSGHHDAPLQALNAVCEKFFQALMPLGISYRRLTGVEFHQWMLRWFNPVLDSEDVAMGEAENPMEAEAQLPCGDGFTESLFFAHPRSDQTHRAWWFDQSVSRCISVEGVRKRPRIGHTNGEVKNGDAINTMMDQLPEGTVMVSTVVIVPQDSVELHIEAIAKSAIGDAVESSRTKADCDTTKRLMGARHKMYRAAYAFYVQVHVGCDRAKNASQRSGISGESDSNYPGESALINRLDRITSDARSVLLRYGLRAIATRDDVRSLDQYVINLPMNYDPDLDRLAGWRHAQLTWVQHIANLSPLFGRSTGTGHPGILQFNRGGAPLMFDPLNKKDREKNAHMLLVGPTGAGKSATLVGILAHVMGIYRPRLFIIESGNSFGLMADWFRTLGLSVHEVSMKPSRAPSLSTFADAALLLDRDGEVVALPESADESADGGDRKGSNAEMDDSGARDVLGELEIIATLMITGGEAQEAALLRRADRRLIRDAILQAARSAYAQQVTPLTEHVREAFYALARAPERTEAARQRIREMGDAIGLFCDGFSGAVFNRPGTVWPEADVTLIDLAHFAREGYEAHLAISVISLLNTINFVAERDQQSARDIVVTIDEAHIITTNPLLSPYLVKIVKMWRKLGAWLWLATQNLDDFPGDAKKLLNMMEWWICLVMPKEEVQQIRRFRELTVEQESMLLSASKADRQYTEGVVLAKHQEMLFRIVPPSLILTLAMTERHEKHERAALMASQGISEVAAAQQVADSIDADRGIRV